MAASTIPPLRCEASAYILRIYRGPEATPLLVQNAEPNKRPFIHPITAPDGIGTLTENTPPHHPWQHGLYVGLNRVNGVGFWTEGLVNDPADGTFHPKPLQAVTVGGHKAEWTVETEWRGPDGSRMITEWQHWMLHDRGDGYELDLEWTLQAETDLVFGQYAYGGLFVRMPYRVELGGQAINSEGLLGGKAEGQRARWAAIHMPIEGRDHEAGMVFMDHPDNPEHPVPWRVDGQLGISPSRCIAGDWKLDKGHSQRNKYRVYIFCGPAKVSKIEENWREYTGRA